ncbi:Regulator of polyketide synthase expression [Bacillus thermotolerans]|nr:Regulator of polyketide synthase expression [Bacillus thermotolerans]
MLTETIIREAVTLLGGGKGEFFVFDNGLKQLIPQASCNMNKTERRKLAEQTKKIFDIQQNRERRSFKQEDAYFFPITKQKEFLGALVVMPQQNHYFSNEQINLIHVFMQSVPIILENSRLFLIMQRRAEGLTYMNQLRRLIDVYSFQDILADIVQKVGELLHSEMAGIMLYEPGTNELVLQKPAFGSWQESVIKQYRVPLTENSNAKNVFLTGTPSITADAPSDPRYSQRFIKLFQAKTLITAPLIVDNKRIGVLHAINKKNGYFTQIDLESLVEISKELGVILNAALQMAAAGTEEYKRLEIERHLIQQLFTCLINSNEEKLQEAADIVKTLGLSLEPRVSVLKVGLYNKKGWDHTLLNHHSKSLIAKIERVLNHSCAIYKDGALTVLVPHELEFDIEQVCLVLQKQLQDQMNTVLKSESESKVLIGIGESVESLRDVCHSYQQAERILNALPYIQHIENVGYYPSCGSWTLLSSMSVNDSSIVSEYTNLYLKKINEFKNAKEVKETLEAYLRHNGHIKKTAEELFIHQNTLKYRLERIQDMTGFDLNDFEVRLNLTLALRLEQLKVNQ